MPKSYDCYVQIVFICYELRTLNMLAQYGEEQFEQMSEQAKIDKQLITINEHTTRKHKVIS